ncbi:MAG: hypothetical protein ACRDZ7_12975 [Acidimicrobiia bacterium]
MLRHVVPAALERYCALRNLSPAEAVAELERIEDILGTERPVLVRPTPTPRAEETLATLVAGL